MSPSCGGRRSQGRTLVLTVLNSCRKRRSLPVDSMASKDRRRRRKTALGNTERAHLKYFVYFPRRLLSVPYVYLRAEIDLLAPRGVACGCVCTCGPSCCLRDRLESGSRLVAALVGPLARGHLLPRTALFCTIHPFGPLCSKECFLRMDKIKDIRL